jgi:dihydrofolate synthase/folylpolyglutamate synthase
MKFNTLSEAQVYLETFIKPTVFERIEENGRLQDPLDRMRVLLQLLGNPERKFRSIQVSGTSGKGSTTYLLAHILEKAGFRTGFASSPHLQSITERMQINMRKISDEKLLSLINELYPVVGQMRELPEGEPSYFELITALAFMYFAKAQVDIAVIEVGLEGKYDATNVLNPLAVVITNISRDHTDMLGSTELEISHEAFSIVRQNMHGKSPVVISGVKQQALRDLLKEKTHNANAQLKLVDEAFTYVIKEKTKSGILFDYQENGEVITDIEVRLRGEYQAVNASLAIAATKSLTQYEFVVSEQAIREGLQTAFFPGRFEVIMSGEKTIILDGAHNEAKMRAFLKALNDYYPNTQKTFIIGFKQGKDTETMIKDLFGVNDSRFIVTEFQKNGGYTRSGSMELGNLQSQVRSIDPRREVIYKGTVSQAFEEALHMDASLIVVTGSLYLVGEMREYLFPSE